MPHSSQHMFSIIRPGMKMADVDRLAREYNFEQLKAKSGMHMCKEVAAVRKTFRCTASRAIHH